MPMQPNTPLWPRPMINKRRRSYGLLSLMFVAMGAEADMLDKSGMAPWEVCALCHSADGVSVMPKFPKLAGQKAAYIESQLLRFRHGERVNDGGQMQTISTEVELRDLAEISSYFSALPLPPSPAVPLTEYQGQEHASKVKRGRQLFYQGDEKIPACAQCHADKNSAAPWLDGQHRAYIEKQLMDFSSGRRRDLAQGKMPGIANNLNSFDRESLAIFLESERLVRH